MAKKVSALSLVLGATAAPMVSGLKQAGKAVDGLVSKVGSAGSAILKFTGIAGAIGSIAGGAGIGFLVHQQLEAIDVNAKLADRLGLTTESISGLQHAASLAGVSNDELVVGLQKLQLNAPGKTIEEIADQLKAISSPAERAKVAVELFGKTGQRLLPLFSEGAEGIKKAMKEAELLGLTFNRIDAAKVEEANDAWTRAKSVITGVGRQLAIALAPFLTAASDSLTQLGIKIVAGVKTFIPVLVQGITTAWNFIQTVFGAIYNFVAPIVSAVWQVIQDNWEASLTSTVYYLTGVWDFISAVGVAVWNIISTLWTSLSSIWNSGSNDVSNQTVTMGNNVASIFSTIGGWGRWLQETLGTVCRVAAFALRNWGDTAALVGDTFILFAVRTGAQAAYWFTEVIPSLFIWFGEMTVKVFTDIMNAASAIFTNMGKNIANFFQGVWSFLKGDGFDFQWTGLLEGFEFTMKELPKIAEREVGPLEAALQKNVDALADAYGTNLGTELVKGQQDAANIAAQMVTSTAKAFEAPFKQSSPELALEGISSGLDDVNKKSKEAARSLNFVLAGSAESQKLRYEAMFNPPEVDEVGDGAANVSPIARRNVETSGKTDAVVQLLTELKALALVRNSTLDEIERSSGFEDIEELVL